MSLTKEQKNYIKKNIRHYSAEKIADDLGIFEKEVLEYLKKKWSREKYRRYLGRGREPETGSGEQNVSFSFLRYIGENWIILAGLIFLVIFVYANSFFNGFVSDDIAGFAKNPNLGKLSAITGNPMHFSLPGFLQTIAYYIGGLHPFTFRIINILAHLGSVILIFILLDLSMNKKIAIFAASLFAVHPILIESVSWISGGLYSIYSFFFLLSFFFYLFSENNKKYYAYSIVFFIFSIFSSEKATVLFLVFVLYEFVFGDLRHRWKKVLPFFLISSALLILFVSKIGYRVSAVQAESYQSAGGLFNPFVQIPIAISSYLKLMFWPAKLSLYQTEMTFSRGQFMLAVLVFLVFLGAVAWSYFKEKRIFFWLVFFVITLLPTLTPFKISWVVAERYVYLGSLGIFVVAAIVLNRLIEFNNNSKMIGYFALAIVVASLSVRTVIRNRDWRNEDTLWLATAKVAPSGQTIHNNLGDVYARQGDLSRAAEEFNKAIAINPNYADAYHNLANTYQQMENFDGAIENYQKAIQINPSIWQSHQNLAGIYYQQGRYDQAIDEIKKAIAINPNDQNLQQSLQVIEKKLQGE